MTYGNRTLVRCKKSSVGYNEKQFLTNSTTTY